MKRFFSLALSVVLGASFLTACGSKGTQVSTDPKTINVRVYKAGFGDAWAYELKSKFEALYQEEGYKMNITPPSIDNNGSPMIQEMYQGYEKTGIDLYIIGSLFPNSVVDGEYGTVVEDLTELVYDQKAINYDGTESEKTIKNKVNQDTLQFMYANDGTLPVMAWAQTSAGVVVNTKKLNAYGITELPKTTNEWFEIIDKIYMGSNGVDNSLKSRTYPLTYAILGSGSYSECAIGSWFAQYDIDAYNEFMRFQKQNGDSWTDMTDEECYAQFDNENLKEVLTTYYRIMDPTIAADGSASQDLDQAQGLIMKDMKAGNNAIFMFNGDWFLNEVKLTYKRALNDITFMNVPVISALGVKLFGNGTVYNKSEEDCDKILSYMCGLVDENKDKTEIKTLTDAKFGIDLQQADVDKVCDARGVCFSRGVEHSACITKDSAKKDIAALALRMLASDDFAATFQREANATTPYVNMAEVNSEYKFCNDAMKLVLNKYSRSIVGRCYGKREKITGFAGIFFPGMSALTKDICLANISMYNADYNKGTVENTHDLSVYEQAGNGLWETIKSKAKALPVK